MKVLVSGSAGHLGEALVRTLSAAGHDVVGLDILRSPFTTVVGSIADTVIVAEAMQGVQAVLHTATLHKPHIVTHSRREFVDTNIVGTLNLLEAAAAARVRSFVYTSTTSVYGLALVPETSAPAAWITEDVVPQPKNIYGVTKKAAEDLCELFHRKLGLPCVVLRTSRFFPDEDDDAAVRHAYADDNVKVNEFAYRRVDLEDVVTAHVLAVERAPALGLRRYVISATTPFSRDDLPRLRTDAAAVLRERFATYEREYARRGWKMFPTIDRVYDSALARNELGWMPRWTFGYVLACLTAGDEIRSSLATSVGFKGYHAGKLAGEMYPTE
jgi:nucleoside-diphosphate-sugar epimerase